MALSRQGRRNRAPRVTIPNQEIALINLDGKQQAAVLCKLSINGGSVRPTRPFSSGTLAEIALRTTSGKIVSAIQLLKSDGNGRQGFRFLQLDPANRSALQSAIDQMRRQGYGDSFRLFQFCSDAARRMLEIARAQIS